jgi:hypothetical protein
MHGILSRRLAGVAGGALLILALLPATALAFSSPTITSVNSTQLAIGAPGYFTVTTSGYPTASISESGALPTGVTFVDNGNGTATLGGIPAQGSSPSWPIIITAMNGTAPNATQGFTLTVTGGLPNGITSAATTTFTVGTPGYFLVNTNFTPIATNITETGTLPSGVTFTNYLNGTAVLAGTPAAATNGSYPLTVTASNGTQSVSQSFTLTVSPAGVVSFTSAASTTFTPSVYGSFSVTATGTPTPAVSLYSGSLPSGVYFTPGTGTGTLYGTPTVIGTYPLTFSASSTAGTVYQSFTLTVGSGSLAFTSAASTTFTPSVYGSFSVTATGTPTPAVSLYSGSLPSGVYFTPGTGTGTLYGTPTVIGTYPLTFSASSTAGTVYQSFTLTVGQAATSLLFATQPGGGAAGAIWAQQPVVEVVNSNNQVVSTDNSTIVYLSIATNPAGGTLSCTGGTSEVAVNGYAYFTGCSINLGSASAYTLYATSNPSWTAATSGGFYIGGTQAAVTIASDTAIGQTTSGFSRATKIVRPGTWITVRFQTSPMLAGRTLGVWIAKKTNGVWGAFSPHASITTNSSGVAYYQYRTSSTVWESFLVKFAGDSTAAPSSSSGTQVRWL